MHTTCDMYLGPPPAFPPTASHTMPRPSRSRRVVAETNHMPWPVAPSSVVFGGAWLTTPLLSLQHPCKSPASAAPWELLASLPAWQNTTMPLAPRATSATRPLSPRPRKDDLEVESQQRSYRRQMDRKLALLRFVFTPRDTA